MKYQHLGRKLKNDKSRREIFEEIIDWFPRIKKKDLGLKRPNRIRNRVKEKPIPGYIIVKFKTVKGREKSKAYPRE